MSSDKKQLIEVQVFRRDGGRMVSVRGANVVLGGGYGQARTGPDGKATFILPASVSRVEVYVNGNTKFTGYIYEMPQPLVVVL